MTTAAGITLHLPRNRANVTMPALNQIATGQVAALKSVIQYGIGKVGT